VKPESELRFAETRFTQYWNALYAAYTPLEPVVPYRRFIYGASNAVSEEQP
jgi:hypothetical protein